MKEFEIKASADDLMLSVAIVTPARETEARGILQIVHGMCEHKERYYEFMEWMASKGYIVICHDHRGHGASIKEPADLGYMYNAGWQGLVEDVRVVGDWARAHYQCLPFTLFGHSMGSMVVRSYVKRYPDTIHQLFVCGCPSRNPAAAIGKALARLYGVSKGWHYRPALLQKLSFGSFNRGFASEGYPSAWVCSDRRVLDAYHSDPLCQYVFTANGFYNLMGLMQDCYSSKGWRVTDPLMPVHFISGALDPCRGSNKAIAQAADMMRRLGYRNVSLTLFPGMRHEILNETDRQTVWDFILARL